MISHSSNKITIPKTFSEFHRFLYKEPGQLWDRGWMIEV
jgi:hypothetical protein